MRFSLKKLALCTIALAPLASAAFANPAGNTATQTVTYSVSAIDQISVSGSPTLTVHTATAGNAPDTANDFSTSYSITTNETNKKITASLDSDMDSGLTLSLSAQAPNGATSAGTQVLSSTAVDLVTGISTVNQSGLTLNYSLAATAAAGVVSSATKTVTFTIL